MLTVNGYVLFVRVMPLHAAQYIVLIVVMAYDRHRVEKSIHNYVDSF